MINIINFPKSWADINVEQFVELIEFIDECKNDDVTLYDSLLTKLAILTDIDINDEEYDDMDIDELFAMINQLKWSTIYPTNECKNELIINKITYILKDITKISLGEYIDLDYYLTNNNFKSIHNMAAILYRQNKIDEWNNIIIEPYSYDLIKRSEMFMEISILDIYSIMDKFIQYKLYIIDKYKYLFDIDINENDDENIIDDELNEKERKLEQVEEQKDKLKLALSWELQIYTLSNNDITKFDDVTNLPLIYVLNMMSMKKMFEV